MIISQDTLPEKNLYFIGGIILLILKNKNNMSQIAVYEEYLALIRKNNFESVGLDLFYLALDWLYLIGAVDINDETKTVYIKGR